MKTSFLLLFILSGAIFATASANPETISPPKAKTQVKTTEFHGQKLLDPYFWLREKENKDVIRYLNEENRYTEAVMKDTDELQKQLFEEMKSRIRETDLSVPEKMGPYYYYSRTEEGKQYRIHCRKLTEPNALEEVIFDENKYAQNKPYFALGVLKISPDHNILAYSVDYSGAEKFELHFLNLTTAMEFSETVASTSYGLTWAEDNRTVFYTLVDDTGRSDRIMKHRLGSDVASDTLVYQEKDGQFWCSVSKTRDRRFILISTSSSTSSEVRFIDAKTPDAEFQMLRAREKGIEYGVEHQGSTFYILTNENAVNFKIMKTADNDFAKEKWQTFIDHRPDVLIDDIDAFAKHIMISERDQGLQKLRFFDIASSEFKPIEFSEAVYSVDLDANPEYETSIIRYRYTSLTTPESVYDYNLETGTAELKKQYEVLGSFKSADYISERIYA
ncbi:MAG: oligopeptidase B, partial [Candidatus Riflebacteria bacterium]